MLPRERTDVIKNGKIATLDYSRYWAQEAGQARARGRHGNMIMAGGTKSTEELIASTKKGVWSPAPGTSAMVDPQTLLLTGLTRDGTFYIENGKIKHPVKNFRFNESPVIMLNNIDELGKPAGHRRRRGALPDADPADEDPRLHVHLAVGRGVR